MLLFLKRLLYRVGFYLWLSFLWNMIILTDCKFRFKKWFYFVVYVPSVEYVYKPYVRQWVRVTSPGYEKPFLRSLSFVLALSLLLVLPVVLMYLYKPASPVWLSIWMPLTNLWIAFFIISLGFGVLLQGVNPIVAVIVDYSNSGLQYVFDMCTLIFYVVFSYPFCIMFMFYHFGYALSWLEPVFYLENCLFNYNLKV